MTEISRPRSYGFWTVSRSVHSLTILGCSPPIFERKQTWCSWTWQFWPPWLSCSSVIPSICSPTQPIFCLIAFWPWIALTSENLSVEIFFLWCSCWILLPYLPRYPPHHYPLHIQYRSDSRQPEVDFQKCYELSRIQNAIWTQNILSGPRRFQLSSPSSESQSLYCMLHFVLFPVWIHVPISPIA